METRECTVCHERADKTVMLAKKVIFQEIGKNGRQIRSRIVAHMCPKCIAKDPDYKQPRWSGAPGMRGANVTVL